MSAQCPQTEPETPPKGHRRPGRTREAQRAKRFRAELVAHAGGGPSITMLAMIDQAVELKRRLLVMDRRFSATEDFGGTTNRYLAWSNALSRLLRQIGLTATAAPPVSAAARLAAHVAARASASPAPSTVGPVHSPAARRTAAQHGQNPPHGVAR